ncbi:hypothetical protein JS756_02465 [Streptomyces actuosus]|uniref:Uncharacterized protein n=1 Tax=Streptomyces actuosus TaxID=1885 RepID=A0ABS2VIX0_STRAS|nr:hypothetical protein [Streptomyces actuosus]MBN0042996.1 hypothetical protein [Streptomyces actuosus]
MFAFVALDVLSALLASVLLLALFDRRLVPALLPAAWVVCLSVQTGLCTALPAVRDGRVHRVLRSAALVSVAGSVAWWFAPGVGLLHDTLFALPVTVSATLLLRQARRLRMRTAAAATPCAPASAASPPRR